MRFADIATAPFGAKYLLDTLPLSSAATRAYIMERQSMNSAAEIVAYRLRFDCIAASDGVRIAALLGGLKNVGNTLNRLSEGNVLDDVELFEVKRLAMLTRKVAELIIGDAVALPDPSHTIEILDPDRTGVASFYIYDSYEPELVCLRASSTTTEGVAAIMATEQRVRERISAELRCDAEALTVAMRTLFEIDFMIAVGNQNRQEGFTMPRLGNATCLRRLVNPVVRSASGGTFQPVDVMLSVRPSVVVGANMGGKTVTLRSMALAQTALQFGFGVAAAEESEMELFDEICYVADSSEEGYSSFGAEIRAIDRVIRAVADGRRVLALIDEPARTTNPTEGRALVEALVEVCRAEHSRVMIATHYNIEGVDCARFRVRGLCEGRMDYELIAVEEGDVPCEALAVAEMMGADRRWIENAKKRIKDGSNK